MLVDLKSIKTETRNSNTVNIDTYSTYDILKTINDEDKKVPFIIEQILDDITKVVDALYIQLDKGGKLVYVGAGTSGRIGVIDAVECYPTYGVKNDVVTALIAGGSNAFIKAVEGAEDDENLAIEDLKRENISEKDFVIGIAASGRTPYVVSALNYAKKVGAKTSCIVTSANSIMEQIVDYKIVCPTGSEVITGSTRMKSGTAQKMICNMISTAVMIKLGHVYSNLMIDVVATNEKLVSRSISIIKEITNANEEEAKKAYDKYKNVKMSVISILTGIEDENEINKMLIENKNNLRKVIGNSK